MKFKMKNAICKISMQNSKPLNLKLYIFTFHLSLLILLCGCAKVVTPEFQPGKTITINVNFMSALDTINNKYYIIFNKNAAPQIPFDPNQFVEPGEIAQQPNIDYYGQIYPTWMDYIVLDGNTFYLVAPPYTSEAIPTREALATINGPYSNSFMLTLDLSRLGNFVDSDRLNFDILSVDKTAKIVEDNLSLDNRSPSSYYVFTITNSVVTGSDETMSTTAEAWDIGTWRVMVQ